MTNDGITSAGTHYRTTACITERQTPYGCWWRYTHAKDDPKETLEMAIRIAGDVAAIEARKSDKSYVVALTAAPATAVYVFASDHPDAARIDIDIIYELTPAGGCIRRRATLQ